MSRLILRRALPAPLLALSLVVLLTLSPSAHVGAQTPSDADGTNAARPASTAGVNATQSSADSARVAELQAQAKALRAEADATFQAAEPACYKKFLVNRCIDQAKQRRLETIQRARALESEAHQLKLEQRQRAAAETQAAQRDAAASRDASAADGAADVDIPTSPAATVTPQPMPDIHVVPDAAAERIRAERARSVAEAEAGAQAARAARDAEKADKRAKTEAEAAARAAAADQDRARYEERLRKYEEEQAAKKK